MGKGLFVWFILCPQRKISSIGPTSGQPGTTVRMIGETDTKGGYYQIIGFGRIVEEGQ